MAACGLREIQVKCRRFASIGEPGRLVLVPQIEHWGEIDRRQSGSCAGEGNIAQVIKDSEGNSSAYLLAISNDLLEHLFGFGSMSVPTFPNRLQSECVRHRRVCIH